MTKALKTPPAGLAIRTVAVGLVLALMPATAQATAATPTCFGEPATIVGTDRADTIKGTSGDDVIFAGHGWDVVDGGAGNDRICGGAGKDELHDGPGRDKVSGGGKSDHLVAGRGDDVLVGGPRDGFTTDWVKYVDATGPVVVDLSEGTATGALGHDVVRGFLRAVGSRYDDVLRGGDTLIGGCGDDILDGRTWTRWTTFLNGAGSHPCRPGESDDDVLYAGPKNSELFGGCGNDRIHGGPRTDEYVNGRYGNGFGADDCWPGETDDDVVSVGRGNDVISYESLTEFGAGSDDDIIRAGRDYDHFYADANTDTDGLDMDLAARTFTLDGASGRVEGIERVTGTEAGDTILGDDGHNSFMAEGGATRCAVVGGTTIWTPAASSMSWTATTTPTAAPARTSATPSRGSRARSREAPGPRLTPTRRMAR